MNALAWLFEHRAEILAGVAGVVAAASVLIKALEVVVALLVTLFPGLKGINGELLSMAGWLDKVARSGLLNALALSPKATKTLALALGLGLVLHAAPARASGLDWSAGPTVPFLEFDVGNPHPVQVAPGMGLQLSITHDALKREFLGKSWDVADLDLAAFGSVVSGASGQQFGTLSLAASVCTMSSLLCVGGGKHVLASDQSFTRGGWFLLLSFSFNFALAPTSPPAGIESGAAGLPRANTLYLGRF